ncbi:MAG: carboxymuconolactone decarboxylase family protein [Chloroflexi bacterium]|nr:carboxymuconolactone decarboxylase family protein [Chloroflexota bacterium]
MSRVRLIEPDDADTKVLESYQSLERSRGSVPNLFKALGYSGAMLGPALGVADFTGIESKIPVKEKQLAYLVASRVNHCEYCLERHSKAALKAGLGEAQIAALHQEGELAENPLFSERERLIIHFAEELTHKATATSAHIATLRPTFNDEEIVELALVISSANMFNRLANGLGIELEKDLTK